MNYITHNDEEIDNNMTCLQGYCPVGITYFQLKKLFGKPLPRSGDYKVEASWTIKFEDGTVATIYNWKDGVGYLGRRHGTPKSEIILWNIGGFNKEAVTRVLEVLNERTNTNT